MLYKKMNIATNNASTFRSLCSLVYIAILSLAVIIGSEPGYENKQQYYAYATTLPASINFAAVGDWGMYIPYNRYCK
jgi:hypothetical protein